jgi:glutamyl-Q tRNA(Asp) synthetase
MGSLVAALGSFLDARSHEGEWCLRIDDIDPPRHDKASFRSIPLCLESHGLTWDGPIIFQSQRREAHEDALSKLRKAGHLFDCLCTRATLGELGACVSDCRNRRDVSGSVRFHVPSDAPDRVKDLFLGEQGASAIPSNFIVKRRDGLIAYQLATAIDDLDEGYTHVIRGADLLESSLRQMMLHQTLGRLSPEYGHLPIVTDQAGNKLSKQTGAQEIDTDTPNANLRRALAFLGQPTPPQNVDRVEDILQLATVNWRRDALNSKNL